MTTIDIDAVESRIEELRGEYTAAWRVHNDAIGALPDDATLRDMDQRRDKAAELTRDALAAQDRIAGELIDNATAALEWSDAVLDFGDFSDGLDGMDRESLTRVVDRAIMRGDKARAMAAAQLLDADGDKAALPRLSANYDDVRVALEYQDAYGDNPSAVLAPLRSYAARMPDDSRIRPNVKVARQIEREDAKLRAAKEEARLEASQKLRDELSRVPGAPTRLVSNESRERRAARRRRAPYGHGG